MANAQSPREPAEAVAESFVGLMRTVRRAKARMLNAAGSDIDSASQVLLHALASGGPMRASALAEKVHADLSTVSRQVTVLVGRGLLERRADQCDGRATVLALTGDGRAAIARHEQGRQRFFEDVLSGWSPGEMRQFAEHLERFTAAYGRVHDARLNTSPGPDTSPGNTDSHHTESHHTELEEGSQA